MRRVDITVGKDYGFTQFPGQNRVSNLLRARRCTVLEVGFPSRAWASSRRDGVKILDHKNAIERNLTTRQIIARWADVEPWQRARKAAAAEKDKRAAAYADEAAGLMARLHALGVAAHPAERLRAEPWRFTLEFDQLMRLAELAEGEER